MPKSTLRKFPEEVSDGPWPYIQPTPNDLDFVPQPKPTDAQEPVGELHGLLSLESPFFHIASAILEGALLGALLFVLSCMPLLMFWLPQWHWISLGEATVVLYLLLDIRYTVRISIASALIIGWGAIIFTRQPFGLIRWLWLYPGMVFVGLCLLFLLFNYRRAMIIVLVMATVTACWLSWPLLMTHLLVLFAFSVGGALIRCIV